jgi:hypothetical protein
MLNAARSCKSFTNVNRLKNNVQEHRSSLAEYVSSLAIIVESIKKGIAYIKRALSTMSLRTMRPPEFSSIANLGVRDNN